MKNSNTSKSLKLPRITIRIVVDILIWLSVGIPSLFLFLRGSPKASGFYCDDPSLSFPNKPDSISTIVLSVSGFVISVVVVILVEVLNYLDGKYEGRCRRTTGINVMIKLFFFLLVGFALEQLSVDVVKNIMGVPRPNFFDVCKPQFNRSLCPGYISEYVCTNNNTNDIRSVLQSFPSGHAAFSMYMAIFLCLFIGRQLKVHFSSILTFVLQFVLVFLAVLCGVGRVIDNKHHSSDVIAGIVIGFGIAVAMFKLVVENVIPFDSVDVITDEHIPKISRCYCHYNQSPEEETITPSPLLGNKKFFSHDSGDQQTDTGAKLSNSG